MRGTVPPSAAFDGHKATASICGDWKCLRGVATSSVPDQRCITVADLEPDDYAQWSPDGNTLYFTSGADGFTCLWAQRLDGNTRRPLGDAFAVQHFHGRTLFQHSG